ncbi:uncharacterized protein BT62DRAFT_989790 [Guyanagaster necrorhizus]|uniref:MIT domain-containing protein n=1 Tax=Guyanagaster necrorhizus TaxID=856835 RepID=A0A9P8AYJ2_9AGAR|nr:uncharacterized protein BT62DRAFT_989790 [Guyanagaster necrorhizus MCA 3950]KAG7452703.1 hypothetical protein BT62DRAFT_989790 [Guyanagaster necrorhizus MCA 3950]
MPQIDMPMNTAHQHAANAEDFLNNGLLIPAAEEHSKAAEAYLAAVERSTDDSAKRTLQMLYNEHRKAGTELERRIEKLREDGKDPLVPQKRDIPKLSATPNFVADFSPNSSPPPQRHMTDLQATVDESFMLLGGQRSDPGDAFNHWWNFVQAKFDQHSEAVAFASAPLGFPDTVATPPRTTTPPIHRGLNRDSSLSSDEEPMMVRLTKRLRLPGMSKDANRSPSKPSNLTLGPINPPSIGDFGEEIFDEGDELSESFFLIPSDSEPSNAALKKENIGLKVEVETLQRRLEAAEKAMAIRKEQDIQLRDSIYQATKEVAQRTMGTSMNLQRTAMDLNPHVPVPLPIPGYHTAREAQYARRVKELEDDLRAVRVENEKHKAMIVKFRDQWEKLKASAKRKKEAKAKAAAAERIVEEPEAEERLDDH